MGNEYPDRKRPGFDTDGKWIGYAEWGKLMDRPDKGRLIVIIILLVFLYFLIAPSFNKSKRFRPNTDNQIEQLYYKSDFFFPELDTIVIYRSDLGENKIITNYLKYGLNWREKFYEDYDISDKEIMNDLIDGTYASLDSDNKKSKKDIKKLRFYYAESFERLKRVKIGQLQEAKRVIEDGEIYPWDGKYVYSMYNKNVLKRKREFSDYSLEFAVKIFNHWLFTPLIIIGLTLNFFGIILKRKKIWAVLKKVGFFLWIGTLIIITITTIV